MEESFKFLLTLATLANPPIYNGLTLSSNSIDSRLNSATAMDINVANQRICIFISVSSSKNELITKKTYPSAEISVYMHGKYQLLPDPGSVSGMALIGYDATDWI